MLNVKPVLDRYKIRTHVLNMGVQDIGILVRESDNPPVYAQKFLFDLFSVQIEFTDSVYAGILCKHVVKSLIETGFEIDDNQMMDIVDQAEAYTKKYCADPNNSYMWSKDPENEPKIKQNKQTQAMELYQQHVIEGGMSNPDFVQVLMDELDMTKSGASNYAWRCKSQEGLPE